MRDNTYDVQVYADAKEDARVSLLQRALHAELCRVQPHGLNSFMPACDRAAIVARRYQADAASGRFPAASREVTP